MLAVMRVAREMRDQYLEKRAGVAAPLDCETSSDDELSYHVMPAPSSSVHRRLGGRVRRADGSCPRLSTGGRADVRG